MRHALRQEVINELGQKVMKVVQSYGELGSGVCDKNGREIFEGDILKLADGSSDVVKFCNGEFRINIYALKDVDKSRAEVVGHA